MKPSIPVWAIPFLLVLLGITLLVGHLQAAQAAAVSSETLVVVVYILVRSRSRSSERPIANVLPLLPGHLLLLLAISLLREPGALGWFWAVLPPVSVAYDVVARSEARRARTSILAGLYGILWADVFYLLERVVVLGRGISGHGEIMAAVAFGATGVVFLATGVHRHRHAAKE